MGLVTSQTTLAAPLVMKFLFPSKIYKSRRQKLILCTIPLSIHTIFFFISFFIRSIEYTSCHILPPSWICKLDSTASTSRSWRSRRSTPTRSLLAAIAASPWRQTAWPCAPTVSASRSTSPRGSKSQASSLSARNVASSITRLATGFSRPRRVGSCSPHA